MPVVNMLDAKTSLSRLVEAVESGAESEIIIARNGKPAAKLVPVGPSKKGMRELGRLAGKYPPLALEDFNSSDEEIAKLFAASKIEPSA
jgi:prevent-host-death family protein